MPKRNPSSSDLRRNPLPFKREIFQKLKFYFKSVRVSAPENKVHFVINIYSPVGFRTPTVSRCSTSPPTCRGRHPSAAREWGYGSVNALNFVNFYYSPAGFRNTPPRSCLSARPLPLGRGRAK
jgi:hypothetical protein